MDIEDINVVDEVPEEDDDKQVVKPKELTPGRKKLQSWLNRRFRVVMSDGRIITGTFLCTDKDANVILAMCSEYMQEGGESRNLGLIMIPGRHIVSIEVDMASSPPPIINSQYDRNECESDEN